MKISNIIINRDLKKDRRTWSYNVKIEIIMEGENLDAVKRIAKDDNCAYHWAFDGDNVSISFVGDIGEGTIDFFFSRFDAKLDAITELIGKIAKKQALINDVEKLLNL